MNSASFGLQTSLGLHNYLLKESDPLARFDRRIWVDVEYCQGQKKAYEATPENVFYTSDSLPTKLTDFFLKQHALVDKIRYNYSDDTLTIHALHPNSRGLVVRVRNTGPCSFYIGDNVYLGPPMQHVDIVNGIELNGKLYFTPTLITEQVLKQILCGDSYRFLAGGGVGQHVRESNDLGHYMNWIVGSQGGENWDRSLDGFVPTEANVIDKFKDLASIFKRKADYLLDKNQPLEASYIKSYLHQKEFENISNRLSLLLAQAAASDSETPQNVPLFWQIPVLQTLFGNYPRPLGKVVYSYGGESTNYYYYSSQVTSILPGQDMGISLMWN